MERKIENRDGTVIVVVREYNNKESILCLKIGNMRQKRNHKNTNGIEIGNKTELDGFMCFEGFLELVEFVVQLN